MEEKWCIDCEYYYSFYICERQFFVCTKYGIRISNISYQYEDCPLVKEALFNSEW